MTFVYHRHDTLDAPSRMKVISQMWRTMGQEDKKVVHGMSVLLPGACMCVD